jgi:hypothetical protein
MKEYAATIVAVLLFFVTPPMIRLIDPTAGIYDAGVLQNINLTIISFCIYMTVTWTVIKNIWPDIGEYAKSGLFGVDFKNITSWQRLKVFLCLYLSLFALLAILSRSY